MESRLRYDKLRVRLRRAPRALHSDELWGKKLSRTRWTYFEPHEFRDGRFMGLAWEVIKRDDLLRTEGKAGNRWEPVPTWLMGRKRRPILGPALGAVGARQASGLAAALRAAAALVTRPPPASPVRPCGSRSSVRDS